MGHVRPDRHGQPPRPPHRGLAIWSFPTGELDLVLQRTEKHPDTRVFSGPVEYSDLAGDRPHRTATLLAPNGFMVELYEI